MIQPSSTPEYVEAPNTYAGPLPRVFLAGGITDCPDWQSVAVSHFERLRTPAALLNPRRENFPIHDPTAASAQIRWEFQALASADVVLFWFAAGSSVQPIALYELGYHAGNPGKAIVVGHDPAYLRRQDVVEQMSHARPSMIVHRRLDDLCRAADDMVRSRRVEAES